MTNPYPARVPELSSTERIRVAPTGRRGDGRQARTPDAKEEPGTRQGSRSTYHEDLLSRWPERCDCALRPRPAPAPRQASSIAKRTAPRARPAVAGNLDDPLALTGGGVIPARTLLCLYAGRAARNARYTPSEHQNRQKPPHVNRHTTPTQDQPIAKKSDLFDIFTRPRKPAGRVSRGGRGREGLASSQDGRPVPYEAAEGSVGVLTVLNELGLAFHGWVPRVRRPTVVPFIALHAERCFRSPSSLARQLELSGAPAGKPSNDVAAGSDATPAKKVREITDASRHLVAGAGLSALREAHAAPAIRTQGSANGLMRNYLLARGPTRPRRGIHAPATVQSELRLTHDEGGRVVHRLRVGLEALAAPGGSSSPNRARGSRRPAVRGPLVPRSPCGSTSTPIDRGSSRRCGIRGRRYAQYVEWALDVPMFLVKRGGTASSRATGADVPQLLEERLSGTQAERYRLEDASQYALPRGSPEEHRRDPRRGRAADGHSVHAAHLWTGLLYDDRALAEAEALVDGWTFDESPTCARGSGATDCVPRGKPRRARCRSSFRPLGRMMNDDQHVPSASRPRGCASRASGQSMMGMLMSVRTMSRTFPSRACEGRRPSSASVTCRLFTRERARTMASSPHHQRVLDDQARVLGAHLQASLPMALSVIGLREPSR